MKIDYFIDGYNTFFYVGIIILIICFVCFGIYLYNKEEKDGMLIN